MTKKIVHRVEDGMDRHDVLCTTYQMRNMYRQLGDGFFTTLDVMNYIQHHQVVKWSRPGDRVLDVCCGRGLLLPLLRYHAKTIGGYTGVDIEPKNATFLTRDTARGRDIDPGDYYPFPVDFVEANVADMARELGDRRFDLVVYTSAIEHMHFDTGRQSLVEVRKVIDPKGRMILTCPRTPEDQDGYDTQYRAHVYEWKVSELTTTLKDVGFAVRDTWGLHATKTDILNRARRMGHGPFVERLAKFIPSEWLVPVLAPAFPAVAKEIGMMCEPIGGG